MLSIVRAGRDRLTQALATVLNSHQGAYAFFNGKSSSRYAIDTDFAPLPYHSAPSAVATAAALDSRHHEDNACAWTLFRGCHTTAVSIDENNADSSARELTRRIRTAGSAQQLLQLIEQYGADMNHIHVSALYTRAKALNAVSSMLQEPAMQELLQHMQQLAVRVQQQCAARELAIIMWSCAHLGLPAVVKTLLLSLLQQHVLADAKPHDISHTLWAVAKMDQQVPADQLQQLLSAFCDQLADAKLGNISHTLWAVAKMDQQVPPKQLQQLLSAFYDQLADATPLDISFTLWAVVTMGQQVLEEQLQQLLKAFIFVSADAKPHNIRHILSAVATMGQQLPVQQLQVLEGVFTNKLDAATLQDLGNTLRACAEQQYAPTQLLSTITNDPELLQQQLATASVIDLACMANACGRLGYCTEVLPGALLQAANERCRQDGAKASGVRELANLCWSAAALDLQQQVPQVLELAAACCKAWDGAPAGHCVQLYQVHLWLTDTLGPKGLSGVLTTPQLQQCKEQWELTLTGSANAARFHQEVFATVQEVSPGIGLQQPVLNQRTDDGAFIIDVAVTTATGSQVAIQACGPHRYLRPHNTLTGPTQSKHRALAARGWRVLVVPYFEWDDLKSRQRQQDYMRSRLQDLSC